MPGDHLGYVPTTVLRVPAADPIAPVSQHDLLPPGPDLVSSGFGGIDQGLSLSVIVAFLD